MLEFAFILTPEYTPSHRGCQLSTANW